MSKQPRAAVRPTRSRVWRCLAASACAIGGLAATGAIAHADDGQPADSPVAETGTVDGTVVAVDQPPVPVRVPPDAVVVAVGEPPVPPVSVPDAIVVAVGQPPVPPATVPDAIVVAVDAPPVPSVTVPDARPSDVPVRPSANRTTVAWHWNVATLPESRWAALAAVMVLPGGPSAVAAATLAVLVGHD